MMRRQEEDREAATTATLKKLRDLCLSLQETSERSSWGHPNFVAGKKAFVTFEFSDLRPSIAFRLHPLDIRHMSRKQPSPVRVPPEFQNVPTRRRQFRNPRQADTFPHAGRLNYRSGLQTEAWYLSSVHYSSTRSLSTVACSR
jgi:hypothetical protein